MKRTPLKVDGALLFETECFRDERGAFQTAWERGKTGEPELNFSPGGAFYSYNRHVGTLRGIHYQRAPHGQAKIVSCARGAAFDVIVDLRRSSPTHLVWDRVELKELSGLSLYIPAGCAHGFMTQEDHTIVAYLIEGDYAPESQATIRWNDPLFGFTWPTGEMIISERDRLAADFKE